MVTNVSHHVRLETDLLSVMGVNAYLPVYGRWIAISFSVFTRAKFDDHATSITYGVRPVSNKPSLVTMRNDCPQVTYEDEFDYKAMLASRFPMVRLNVGDGGHKRDVEQELMIPTLRGNILDFSYLADGGEIAGRTIAAAVLRKMESIIEKVRQSILDGLAPEFRERFVNRLAKHYNKHTAKALDSFLASVNWKLLLMRSRCDDRCGDVVDYTLLHNPFVHYGIDHTDAVNIQTYNSLGEHFHNEVRERIIFERMEVIRIANEDERQRQWEARHAGRIAADRVAADMLLEVLGKSVATEYAEDGQISIVKNGYSFIIRDNNSFIKCIDPDGNKAELCIHTVGMSCNPIDEMVIAYLNIEHHFAEYMHKAIVHGGRQSGFRKPRRSAA